MSSSTTNSPGTHEESGISLLLEQVRELDPESVDAVRELLTASPDKPNERSDAPPEVQVQAGPDGDDSSRVEVTGRVGAINSIAKASHSPNSLSKPDECPSLAASESSARSTGEIDYCPSLLASESSDNSSSETDDCPSLAASESSDNSSSETDDCPSLVASDSSDSTVTEAGSSEHTIPPVVGGNSSSDNNNNGADSSSSGVSGLMYSPDVLPVWSTAQFSLSGPVHTDTISFYPLVEDFNSPSTSGSTETDTSTRDSGSNVQTSDSETSKIDNAMLAEPLLGEGNVSKVTQQARSSGGLVLRFSREDKPGYTGTDKKASCNKAGATQEKKSEKGLVLLFPNDN